MEVASAINSNAKRSYDQAADLVERALVADDKEAAQNLMGQALALVQELCRQYQANAEFTYLIGYIHYKTPLKREETWHSAEFFLKRAIELNPAHQFARYYLGCLLFDSKRYSESLDELRQIQQHVFLGMGQQWRIVKIMELRLCCELQIAPTSTPVASLQELMNYFVSFEDLLLAPVPVELGRCLEFLLETRGCDTGLAEMCRIYFKLVRLLGLQQWLRTSLPLLQEVWDREAQSQSQLDN